MVVWFVVVWGLGIEGRSVAVDLFHWPVFFSQTALGVLLEEAGRKIGMEGVNC